MQLRFVCPFACLPVSHVFTLLFLSFLYYSNLSLPLLVSKHNASPVLSHQTSFFFLFLFLYFFRVILTTTLFLPFPLPQFFPLSLCLALFLHKFLPCNSYRLCNLPISICLWILLYYLLLVHISSPSSHLVMFHLVSSCPLPLPPSHFVCFCQSIQLCPHLLSSKTAVSFMSNLLIPNTNLHRTYSLYYL